MNQNHTAPGSARNVIAYVNLCATDTICMFKVTHVLPSSSNLGHKEGKNTLMIIAVSEGFTRIYLNRNHESASILFRAPFICILQMFVEANFCSEEYSVQSKISEIRVWIHVSWVLILEAFTWPSGQLCGFGSCSKKSMLFGNYKQSANSE